MSKQSSIIFKIIVILTFAGIFTFPSAHGDIQYGHLDQKGLETIYSSYLSIESALKKSNLNEAITDAEDFLKLNFSLPKDLSHSIKTLSLVQIYEKMQQDNELKILKISFNEYSALLITLFNDIPYKGKKNIFQFYDQDTKEPLKNYWLQDTKKGVDPYRQTRLCTLITTLSLKSSLTPLTPRILNTPNRK